MHKHISIYYYICLQKRLKIHIYIYSIHIRYNVMIDIVYCFALRPHFDINLDLPPRQRWLEVTKYYRQDCCLKLSTPNFPAAPGNSQRFPRRSSRWWTHGRRCCKPPSSQPKRPSAWKIHRLLGQQKLGNLSRNPSCFFLSFPMMGCSWNPQVRSFDTDMVYEPYWGLWTKP